MRQERNNSGAGLDDSVDTETRLRLIVDKTPALIYSARPDGYTISSINTAVNRRSFCRGDIWLGFVVSNSPADTRLTRDRATMTQ